MVLLDHVLDVGEAHGRFLFGFVEQDGLADRGSDVSEVLGREMVVQLTMRRSTLITSVRLEFYRLGTAE